MKRVVSISVIAFASLLMLVLSVVPHHHHDDGMPCFQTEQVEQNCDKQHAHHHNSASDNASESSNCVVHANFVAQKTDFGVRIKSFPSNYSENSDFCNSLFVFVLSDLIVLLPDEKNDYGEYIFSVPSLEKHNPLGLRGPPYFFA